MKRVAAFLLLLASHALCQTNYQPVVQSRMNIAMQWAEQHLLMIKNTVPFLGPPFAARALAMVQTAVYDAYSPYTANSLPATPGASFPRQVGFSQLAVNESISYAAYRVLQNIYGNAAALSCAPCAAQLTQAGNLLASFGFDSSLTSTDPSTPYGIGNLAAQNVINYRQFDGANQYGNHSLSKTQKPYSDHTNYDPVNKPQPKAAHSICPITDINHWQPLLVANGNTASNQSFLGAQVGVIIPFSALDIFSFRTNPELSGPLLFGTPSAAAFMPQIQQVIDISGQLNDTLKAMTEFWADGPASTSPPGHWHQIAIDSLINLGLIGDVWSTIQLLFLQSNAAFDAGIVAWDLKRFFDTARPISVIQCTFFSEQITAWNKPYMGVHQMNGSDWEPYQATNFVTPPFAEYPSGHSAFSAASAEVLKRFLGSDTFMGNPYTIPAGGSLYEPAIFDNTSSLFVDGITNVPNSGPGTQGYSPATNITLMWATYTEAAIQAGNSRLYGGIHFQNANVDSEWIGRQVGTGVWNLAQTFINPTPASPATTGVSGSAGSGSAAGTTASSSTCPRCTSCTTSSNPGESLILAASAALPSSGLFAVVASLLLMLVISL